MNFRFNGGSKIEKNSFLKIFSQMETFNAQNNFGDFLSTIGQNKMRAATNQDKLNSIATTVTLRIRTRLVF